jgi:hypothetical protein
MSNHITIKLITDTKYHLWCDALHSRELARTATDNWMKGSYVRWTITTAWTVLELCCKDALNDNSIWRTFKVGLNNRLAQMKYRHIRWGKGLWKDVSDLQYKRNYYIHKNADQKELWPEITSAEEAIKVVRNAVKDIYSIANKPFPSWIDDDNEKGRNYKWLRSFIHVRFFFLRQNVSDHSSYISR